MKSDGRFSQDDIEPIRRMILDTKLRPDGPSHTISSRLSAWLVDADLANLGRSDFLEQTRLLARIEHSNEFMLNESLALMNRHHGTVAQEKSRSGNKKI